MASEVGFAGGVVMFWPLPGRAGDPRGHALGGAGCQLPSGEVIPAIRVRVADSAGEGDAFAAGLAVGLARGMTLRDSCRLANVVAGLKVGRRGSSVAMPSWDDVRSRLDELR